MKKFNLLISLGFLIFIGCSEKDVFISDNKELLENGVNIVPIEGVSIRNGVLSFDSTEQYFRICEKLGNISESERDEWEVKLGFVSLRSEISRVLAQLEECENELEYLTLLKDNGDILEIVDDEIKPIIESDSYAAIANRDGYFYIGDVLHKVQDGRIAFSRTGSVAKINEALHGNLKSSDSDVEVHPYIGDNMLKSSGCGSSQSSSYSTSDRRCSFYLKTFIRVTGTSSNTWRQVVVGAKVSNHRKNMWGKWALYHAGCEIRNLDIVVPAPGDAYLMTYNHPGIVSFTYQYHMYGIYDTPLVSNGSSASGVRSLTLWYNVGDAILNTYPGGETLPQPIFKGVKGKASNTGIGLGVKWAEIDCD